MNRKIIEFNKTALKKRQKTLLEVPKKPCYPSPRYFRDISFLKSMVRAWFELEYRKWSKLNKSPIGSLLTEKKSISQGKSPVGKVSINSVDLTSSRKEKS